MFSKKSKKKEDGEPPFKDIVENILEQERTCNCKAHLESRLSPEEADYVRKVMYNFDSFTLVQRLLAVIFAHYPNAAEVFLKDCYEQLRIHKEDNTSNSKTVN